MELCIRLPVCRPTVCPACFPTTVDLTGLPRLWLQERHVCTHPFYSHSLIAHRHLLLLWAPVWIFFQVTQTDIFFFDSVCVPTILHSDSSIMIYDKHTRLSETINSDLVDLNLNKPKTSVPSYMLKLIYFVIVTFCYYFTPM